MRVIAVVAVAWVLSGCGKSAAPPPAPLTVGAPPPATASPPTRDSGGDAAPVAGLPNFADKPPSLPTDPAERRCAIAKFDYASRKPYAKSWKAESLPALPFGQCWSGPKGAWALSIQLDANSYSDPIVTGWVAVHVDDKDKVTRRARGLLPEAPPASDFSDTVTAPSGHVLDVQSFDFDADGDPEFYVGWVSFGAGCNPAEFADGLLLTHKSGVIARYGPTVGLAIWAMKDVDKDGRPDLLTSSPYPGVRDQVVPGFAPNLVAHARRDGTFAMDDAVAAAAARRVCPRKPTAAELAARGMPEAQATSIGCARMWGMSRDAVASAVGDDRSETLDAIIAIDPPILLH